MIRSVIIYIDCLVKWKWNWIPAIFLISKEAVNHMMVRTKILLIYHDYTFFQAKKCTVTILIKLVVEGKIWTEWIEPAILHPFVWENDRNSSYAQLSMSILRKRGRRIKICLALLFPLTSKLGNTYICLVETYGKTDLIIIRSVSYLFQSDW